MHLFTGIQVVLVAILWIVMSTIATIVLHYKCFSIVGTNIQDASIYRYTGSSRSYPVDCQVNHSRHCLSITGVSLL